MTTEVVRRRSRRSQIKQTDKAGLAFAGGYAVLLVALGLVPALYALWMAVTNYAGQFVGLGNFVRVVQDFRFGSAFANVMIFLGLWLVALLGLVLLLALMLHGRMRRTTQAVRFLYYLPGAFAGAASVLLWLILLDPVASPVGILLRALGYENFPEVIAPQNLPVIFVIIAFWTGAGSWIVIMFGALNGIPDDVIEAARLDGAGTFAIAWWIQLPMLKRWIAYMLILGFAGGLQVFVEPQLLSTVSFGRVSRTWSPNQLGYQLAFGSGDLNGASALAVLLLLVSLVCAALVVFKARLFDKD